MAKYNFKVSTEKEPEVKGSQDTGDHQCEVFGCPRLATIKTSHWNCRYHNLRAGNSLDGITLILKNHEREINWYEKVLNMPYHEYELFRGNAPAPMMHKTSEDLIKYRVRMAQYISDLLKSPNRLHIPTTKTYIEFSSEVEL